MTQSNYLELAKQGDPKAIAALLNRSLQPKGITAKAALNDGCLQIMLEAAQVPEQQSLVAFVHKGITTLNSDFIETVKVFGRKAGENSPAWKQDLVLRSNPDFGLPGDGDDLGPPSYGHEEENEVEDTGVEPEVAQKPENPLLKKLLLPLLLLVVLILGGGAAIYFLNPGLLAGIFPQTSEAPPVPVPAKPKPKPTTAAQPQKAAKPTGSTAPQKAASPKTSPTASPTDAAPESFVQAVRTAIAASKATQIAKSADEWNAVATQWQEALDLMKAVPKSNRNYAVAQKRVETYQINLKYAQQKAASAAEQK
jgi:hypothetical protein